EGNVEEDERLVLKNREKNMKGESKRWNFLNTPEFCISCIIYLSLFQYRKRNCLILSSHGLQSNVTN
ncbi:hypothetical protein, partial [Escherichia coli]|uniref:hypothetical protein n=1 Tax=Escherichia coli TaxID=562 RepID=UPI001C5620CC